MIGRGSAASFQGKNLYFPPFIFCFHHSRTALSKDSLSLLKGHFRASLIPFYLIISHDKKRFCTSHCHRRLFINLPVSMKEYPNRLLSIILINDSANFISLENKFIHCAVCCQFVFRNHLRRWINLINYQIFRKRDRTIIFEHRRPFFHSSQCGLYTARLIIHTGQTAFGKGQIGHIRLQFLTQPSFQLDAALISIQKHLDFIIFSRLNPDIFHPAQVVRFSHNAKDFISGRIDFKAAIHVNIHRKSLGQIHSPACQRLPCSQCRYI